MSQTVIRGTQILNNTVQRQDLDVSTVGQAVVTKLVQGSGITLSSTGADAGTGDVTVSSPDVVSTDAGNIAVLGSDNHVLVPQSQIWSVRLRSFNAVGNPTFEVDQKQVGTMVVSGAIDRWATNKSGTMAVSCGQIIPGVLPFVPGTNFLISRAAFQVNLTTAQATLGAGDFLFLNQIIEGPQFRELSQDVHSLSLLVYSSVANLKFAVALRDPGTAKSLVKLCTVASANTWTLISLPNIPVWISGGNFSSAPGVAGYQLSICLAAGTTFIAAAADTWQTGNFIGAPGMDNFASKPVNSQFIAAFVQHEPGALCTSPIDCQFTQNYDDCLRYYQKSYDYEVAIGTASAVGPVCLIQATTNLEVGSVRFHKPMAKVPTMTAYNYATGAANSIRVGGSDFTVTGFNAPNKTGFAFLNASGLPAVAAGQFCQFHYIADTGW